jgi:hypothetical protein
LLNVIIVSLLGIIYFAALFGWGRLVENLLRARWPFPFTICLGLSSLVFLGGILNLAGIAYPLVLDMVIVFGLGLTAVTSFRSWNLKSFSACKEQYLTGEYLARFLPSAILIVIVFGYSSYTLSSPRGFNLHDDFEKYMTHPIRMLATGSLRSGPFDVLGGDTFGGQAFLHGFSVAHFPIGYVNTVDTVLALTLFLMSVLAVAIRERLPFWLIPLIIMIPVFINPQYVNISACYTASVLILFIFLGTWHGMQDPNNAASPLPNAACLGLAYSALATLKTNFLFPAVVHFIVMFFGLICISQSWKNVILWATKLVGFAIFFMLPWGLLYFPYWLASLANVNNPNNAFLRGNYFGHAEPASNLFALRPLFYGLGETFAHYTVIMILIGCCTVFFFIQKHSNRQADKVRSIATFAACATPPILYYVGTIATAKILFGQEDALRFLIPVIIAAVPTSLIMVLSAPPGGMLKLGLRNSTLTLKNSLVAFISVILLGAFFQSFSERVRQAYRYGSILAFHKLATEPGYIECNRFALSSESKNMVQKAQQAVPEKSRLVAWTPLALHLDYKRNDIISVSPAGLVSPWQDFPFGKGVDEGISYIKSLKSYYLLWQYDGFAVRSMDRLLTESGSPFFRHHAIGVRSIQFMNFLRNAAGQSQILYNDGVILVMKFSDNKP